MEGKGLYKCHSDTKELGSTCHSTKNRVIQHLCDHSGEKCKYLKSYLQCLMKMECYCNYIGVCCCEIEKLSHHCVSELHHCCGELIKCCANVSKHFDNHDYLNCTKIESLCKSCMKIKQSKTPKKECPPGKIINPKTGRCINKPKEKTKKKIIFKIFQ